MARRMKFLEATAPTVECFGDECQVTFELNDMPISESTTPRFVYSGLP
jgi:hypothetical protein